MTFVLLAILLIVIYYYAKRWVVARNIPHYSPKEAEGRVKGGKSVFLDVREADERKHSLIKNSFHIPIKQLQGRLNELQRYKDKEIICYCSTGTRSLNAASLLQKNGFQSANMKGGMTAWKHMK